MPSSFCLRLNNPEVITLTHLKICRIEVELDHNGKPGSLVAWMSKCFKQGETWVHPEIPGIPLRFTADQWEQLKGTHLTGLESIQDLEPVLYQLLLFEGQIPQGIPEPY